MFKDCWIQLGRWILVWGKLRDKKISFLQDEYILEVKVHIYKLPFTQHSAILRQVPMIPEWTLEEPAFASRDT